MKAPMFQTHTYVYLYVTMRFQNVPRSIQQAIQQELLVMAIFLTRCPPRPREEMRRVDQRNYRWCNCILLPFVLIERLLFILFQRGPGGISASGAAMISLKKDQTGEIPSVMSASLRSIPIRWVFQQLMEEETLWILKCVFSCEKAKRGISWKIIPYLRGCASPRFQSFLNTKMPWHFSEESGRS